MKNKLNIKAKMLSAAVVTAAFFVGITPMTAYAGGVECSCEAKCTDDHVNEDCPLDVPFSKFSNRAHIQYNDV